eukprot:s548_g10.t2
MFCLFQSHIDLKSEGLIVSTPFSVLEGAWGEQPEAEPPEAKPPEAEPLEAEPPAPQEPSCAGQASARTSLNSPKLLGLASAKGLQDSAPRTSVVPSASEELDNPQNPQRISKAGCIKQKWLQHLHVSCSAGQSACGEFRQNGFTSMM